MSITKLSFLLVWYTLLIIEFGVWIGTCVEIGLAGLTSVIAYVVLLPALLAVEGLELSVTSLLGQKVNVGSAGAASELKQLQADQTLDFFPNRQAFVVAIIVLLTMASSFRELYIPGLGSVAEYGLPQLFNILYFLPI